MVDAWQNKLKEAERAVIRGDLDAARQMLDDSHVRRTPLGKQLTNQVVERITHRAENRARLGDTTAGWQDLRHAQSLAPDAHKVNAAREEMISLALSDVEEFLRNQQTDLALAKLDKLHQRNVAGGRVAAIRQIVLKAGRAERLCQFGKFAEAAEQWAAAKAIREDLNVLAEREASCRNQAGQFDELMNELKVSVSHEDWEQTLNRANQLLALAPQHPVAREVREEAWEKVSENLTESQRLRRTSPWRRPAQAKPAAPKNAVSPHALPLTWAQTGVGRCENQRFQLWIDAVGGFLICLADEIAIGQAVPGAEVDVPVFGNLAHQHARIRRDGEGYVLTPVGEVLVDGRKLDGPAFLADGDEFEPGQSVRFRFRKPHALSATARLESLSGHRSQPAADAILLMAETLVMGPKLSNHIVCGDWSHDVLLFRQGENVHCRSQGQMEIDGELMEEEGALQANSHVRSAEFAFSVEEV